MLDETQQQSLVTRLNRIEGQIRGIRRMVQQDGLSRGGPDGARAGDGMPCQGIYECGLARAGGTTDDGKQGSIEAAVPGQDVVIQLCDGVTDFQPGLLNPRRKKGKGDPGQFLPYGLQEINRRRWCVRLAACWLVRLVFRGHSIIMPVHDLRRLRRAMAEQRKPAPG